MMRPTEYDLEMEETMNNDEREALSQATIDYYTKGRVSREQARANIAADEKEDPFLPENQPGWAKKEDK